MTPSVQLSSRVGDELVQHCSSWSARGYRRVVRDRLRRPRRDFVRFQEGTQHLEEPPHGGGTCGARTTSRPRRRQLGAPFVVVEQLVKDCSEFIVLVARSRAPGTVRRCLRRDRSHAGTAGERVEDTIARRAPTPHVGPVIVQHDPRRRVDDRDVLVGTNALPTNPGGDELLPVGAVHHEVDAGSRGSRTMGRSANRELPTKTTSWTYPDRPSAAGTDDRRLPGAGRDWTSSRATQMVRESADATNTTSAAARSSGTTSSGCEITHTMPTDPHANVAR